MKYNINIEQAVMRVNTKVRAGPNEFPEILFENCILVSKKEADLKYSQIDRLNTIIYPEGCENLDSPETIFVNVDFRHATYDNAGYFTEIKTSQDNQQLLGNFKVGSQHVLIDKFKKEYGSSYASAWMAIAEKLASTPEAIKESKTYKDYIPENVWRTFFENKVVSPLTGLSVELDWTEEPQTDSQGITHIKKYSIVRVSLLVFDKTGQQQSRLNIKNYKIRSMNDELNTIQKNIDLFETSDLLKIRSAELANEYLVYQEIKQRACAMCQAEAKKREEELQAKFDASKTRSEQDVLEAIKNLSDMVMALSNDVQAMKDENSMDNVDPNPVTRDAGTADVEVPVVVETTIPEMAQVEKTRMVKVTQEFDFSKM